MFYGLELGFGFAAGVLLFMFVAKFWKRYDVGRKLWVFLCVMFYVTALISVASGLMDDRPWYIWIGFALLVISVAPIAIEFFKAMYHGAVEEARRLRNY